LEIFKIPGIPLRIPVNPVALRKTFKHVCLLKSYRTEQEAKLSLGWIAISQPYCLIADYLV